MFHLEADSRMVPAPHVGVASVAAAARRIIKWIVHLDRTISVVVADYLPLRDFASYHARSGQTTNWIFFFSS